jgi:hypothetical protein
MRDDPVGRGFAAHVLWPVHHANVSHWSLVRVDVNRMPVISYDSFEHVGGHELYKLGMISWSIE